MSEQEIAQAKANLVDAVNRLALSPYAYAEPLVPAIEDLIKAYLVNHVQYTDHSKSFGSHQ